MIVSSSSPVLLQTNTFLQLLVLQNSCYISLGVVLHSQLFFSIRCLFNLLSLQVWSAATSGRTSSLHHVTTVTCTQRSSTRSSATPPHCYSCSICFLLLCAFPPIWTLTNLDPLFPQFIRKTCIKTLFCPVTQGLK